VKRLIVALSLTAIASSAFAWGTPDWAREAAKATVPAYDSETPGVVLLDERATTVTADGEIRTRRRKAIRILNSTGRDLGEVSIAFDADRRIYDLHAWTITASGEEYALKDRDAVELAAGDGLLYADEKVKVLTLPDPAPGSTIVYEFEQRERPYELQDVWTFQSSLPVRVARYKLTLPAGWTHDEHWSHATAATPQTVANATVWELADIKAVKPEPHRPPLAAIAGRMSINLIPPQEQLAGKAHRTWTDVGKWYATLVGTRRDVTPAIEAKVAELTKGKTTTLAKMRAVAAFTQRDVRYVAIEIGIGGVQPHAAADILANHFGDCKDKATLLGAMLHAIGVDSYYVLVGVDRGTVDRAFPSAGSFDHAVIAIHLPDDVNDPSLRSVVKHPQLGRLLIFDPTNTSTPFGDVPDYLQQTTVLLVTPSGGDALELPMRPADENKRAITAKLAIDAAGTLSGDVRIVLSGTEAAHYRGAARGKTAAERREAVQSGINRDLAEHTIDAFDVDGIDATEGDVTVHYRLTARSFAKKAGTLLLVRPRVVGRAVDSILDLKTRAYGYDTGGPSVDTSQIDVALPAGYAIDELPAAVDVHHDGLTYKSASTIDNDTLHYRREYRVERFIVPVEELAQWNGAFSKILADERASAVLKPKG
jgi:hypothetical protein